MGKHTIILKPEQREFLEHFVHAGTSPARAVGHAYVLLKADESKLGPKWSDQQIIDAFGVSYRTILRIRTCFGEQGMQAALMRKAQPPRPEKRKLDGEKEAKVIAVLCHEKPTGRERWTMRLLAQRVVELEIVECVSHETIRQTLKKTI
jgi:transposase